MIDDLRLTIGVPGLRNRQSSILTLLLLLLTLLLPDALGQQSEDPSTKTRYCVSWCLGGCFVEGEPDELRLRQRHRSHP